MKKLSLPLAALAACIVFLTVTTFSACVKTKVEKDTITLHDTTTKTLTDTVTVNSCGCASNLTKGLIAYYTFTNGSLADSSGYGNNISFNSAAQVADRFGNPNSAYLFDGSSSYMRIPDNASLTPDTAITMMAIFKINGFYTGNCSGNQLIGKQIADYTDGFYCLRISDFGSCGGTTDTSKENVYGSYGDFSTGNITGTNLNSYYVKPGIWYTVVYTYGSDTSKIYVNGVLTSTNAEHASIAADNGQDLLLGRLADNTFPYYFNGIIDEVRIYNRALCASEVTQLDNLTH